MRLLDIWIRNAQILQNKGQTRHLAASVRLFHLRGVAKEVHMGGACRTALLLALGLAVVGILVARGRPVDLFNVNFEALRATLFLP